MGAVSRKLVISHAAWTNSSKSFMSSSVVHVVAGVSEVRGIRTGPVASGSMYILAVGWLLEYPSGKIFRLHS